MSENPLFDVTQQCKVTVQGFVYEQHKVYLELLQRLCLQAMARGQDLFVAKRTWQESMNDVNLLSMPPQFVQTVRYMFVDPEVRLILDSGNPVPQLGGAGTYYRCAAWIDDEWNNSHLLVPNSVNTIDQTRLHLETKYFCINCNRSVMPVIHEHKIKRTPFANFSEWIKTIDCPNCGEIFMEVD